MFAQRNYVLYLAILAVTAISATAQTPKGKPAPATQPAATVETVAAPAQTNPPVPAASATTAPAEESIREIPLNKIWAYQMPGTHPLAMPTTADGKFATAEGKMLNDILGSLKEYGADIRGGFAVAGINSVALGEAYRVFVDGQTPSSCLDRNQRLSLVFFSHQEGYYVNITKVLQKGPLVEISYQFVPRNNKDLTPQIAIIPLNNVPPGTLKVVLHGEGNPGAPSEPPIDPHHIASGDSGATVVECSLRAD